MGKYDDLPSGRDIPDCPNCGGVLKRDINEANSANRTSSRYVGGQNRNVQRKCRDCGWSGGYTKGKTG